jgi:hypothetical protein
MATFTKLQLSGASAFNAPIGVSNSGGMGMATTLHATGTSNTTLDEVWIWCANDTATDATDIRVRFAGGNNYFKGTVPANTTVLLLGGIILKGDGSSVATLEGWEGGSTTVSFFGYVNRIS